MTLWTQHDTQNIASFCGKTFICGNSIHKRLGAAESAKYLLGAIDESLLPTAQSEHVTSSKCSEMTFGQRTGTGGIRSNCGRAGDWRVRADVWVRLEQIPHIAALVASLKTDVDLVCSQSSGSCVYLLWVL